MKKEEGKFPYYFICVGESFYHFWEKQIVFHYLIIKQLSFELLVLSNMNNSLYQDYYFSGLPLEIIKLILSKELILNKIEVLNKHGIPDINCVLQKCIIQFWKNSFPCQNEYAMHCGATKCHRLLPWKTSIYYNCKQCFYLECSTCMREKSWHSYTLCSVCYNKQMLK